MDLHERSSSPSDVCCILCERSEETKITGALSSKEGVSAHQNCLLYASAIYCKQSPTFDDLFGFEIDDVIKEQRRGRKLKCHYCKKKGATVGCEVMSCPRSFHYPCAKGANCKPVQDSKNGIFKLYCVKHASARSSGSSTGRNRQPSVRGGMSSGNDSPSSTGSRCKKRRTEYVISSNSDDEQNIDPILAPLETDLEDITPPAQHKALRSVPGDEGNKGEPTPTTSNCYDKSKKAASPCQSGKTAQTQAGDGTDTESDAESPSFLSSEYRHEQVAMTVITDSIGSESSSCRVPLPSLAAAECDQRPSPPAAKDADTLRTKTTTTTPPTPPVPRHLSFDSAPPGGDGAADPLGSPTQIIDEPLDSHSPPPPAEPAEGAGAVRASDSTAALFWRRCNELGCTETIFGELTEQLICLAERVQTQHATPQDYNIALEILKASGKFTEIFRQQEKDLETRIRELQNKRQTLRDARAVITNHLS